MPLQNRVQPTGDIITDPARGLFMGNRGILHDERQHLGRARWKHRNWVCCRLDFKGRKRPLMAPGRYTELFFLDEAVAFAAGHRPCAECRRADYNAFLDAWAQATGNRPAASELDRQMHAARIEGRAQRRIAVETGTLPVGSMVLTGAQACLVSARGLLPYRPEGYGPPLQGPPRVALLLTPEPVRDALRAGYAPMLHASAA